MTMDADQRAIRWRPHPAEVQAPVGMRPISTSVLGITAKEAVTTTGDHAIMEGGMTAIGIGIATEIAISHAEVEAGAAIDADDVASLGGTCVNYKYDAS